MGNKSPSTRNIQGLRDLAILLDFLCNSAPTTQWTVNASNMAIKHPLKVQRISTRTASISVSRFILKPNRGDNGKVCEAMQKHWKLYIFNAETSLKMSHKIGRRGTRLHQQVCQLLKFKRPCESTCKLGRGKAHARWGGRGEADLRADDGQKQDRDDDRHDHRQQVRGKVRSSDEGYCQHMDYARLHGQQPRADAGLPHVLPL